MEKPTGQQKETTSNNRFVSSVPTVNLIESKKIVNISIWKRGYKVLEYEEICTIWQTKVSLYLKRSEISTKILALSTTNRENVIYSSYIAIIQGHFINKMFVEVIILPQSYTMLEGFRDSMNMCGIHAPQYVQFVIPLRQHSHSFDSPKGTENKIVIDFLSEISGKLKKKTA